MTKKENEILIEIQGSLKYLTRMLEEDHKIIHGNGRPGLIERVQTLENYHDNENSFLRKAGTLIAWLITTAMAAYSIFKHHN